MLKTRWQQNLTFILFSCLTYFLRSSSQVQTDLHFDGIKDPVFDGQITKEYLLEDMLKLLFPACSSEDRSPQSTQDTAEIKVNCEYSKVSAYRALFSSYSETNRHSII